jgi:uncharacterized zinc-type alcohol dehydrogenase-like protein
MVIVGMPSAPAVIPAASLVLKRSIMGSLIGGIAETQEMLDYCAELYGITLMLKVDMAYINEVMNV